MVNEEEAERVWAIFALFEENHSARLTLAEIERRGWRLKSWTRKTGQFRSGGEFALVAERLTNSRNALTCAGDHSSQSRTGISAMGSGLL